MGEVESQWPVVVESQDSRNVRTSGGANSRSVLCLVAQNMQFCIEVGYVVAVLPFMALQAVPGAPRYLAGVMNYHGEHLPVIDLVQRLGLKRAAPYSIDTPIVLCAADSCRCGVIVDSILGVAAPGEAGQSMDEILHENIPMVTATVSTDAGMSLLLNMTELLDFHAAGL